MTTFAEQDKNKLSFSENLRNDVAEELSQLAPASSPHNIRSIHLWEEHIMDFMTVSSDKFIFSSYQL